MEETSYIILLKGQGGVEKTTLLKKNFSKKYLLNAFFEKNFERLMKETIIKSDTEIARMAISDAFCSMEKLSSEKFYAIKELYPYISTVIRNKILEIKKGDKNTVYDNALIAKSTEVVEIINYIEIEKIEKRIVCLVFNEMSKKNKRYVTILKLYYFDSLSIKEIAEELKITDSNAKTRLYRARENFAETWKKLCFNDDDPDDNSSKLNINSHKFSRKKNKHKVNNFIGDILNIIIDELYLETEKNPVLRNLIGSFSLYKYVYLDLLGQSVKLSLYKSTLSKHIPIIVLEVDGITMLLKVFLEQKSNELYQTRIILNELVYNYHINTNPPSYKTEVVVPFHNGDFINSDSKSLKLEESDYNFYYKTISKQSNMKTTSNSNLKGRHLTNVFYDTIIYGFVDKDRKAKYLENKELDNSVRNSQKGINSYDSELLKEEVKSEHTKDKSKTELYNLIEDLARLKNVSTINILNNPLELLESMRKKSMIDRTHIIKKNSKGN